MNQIQPPVEVTSNIDNKRLIETFVGFGVWVNQLGPDSTDADVNAVSDFMNEVNKRLFDEEHRIPGNKQAIEEFETTLYEVCQSEGFEETNDKILWEVSLFSANRIEPDKLDQFEQHMLKTIHYLAAERSFALKSVEVVSVSEQAHYRFHETTKIRG